MNIKQAIEYGIKELKHKESPRNYSYRILEKLLDVDKQYLIINEQQEISQENEKKFLNDIEKIKLGIPLQYITNVQQFMGLDFYVDENVLIPQPDTEILVEEILEIAKENNVNKILDLCTGSGAIGISIAKYLQKVDITMSDISEKALEIAKKNAVQIKVEEKCEFVHSDLFANINSEYDIIVSNPPYIETEVIKSLSKEVQNEPILALDGGKDGLDFYRKIIEQSSKYLKENGYLILEIGYNQNKTVKKIIENSGRFYNIILKKDLQNIDRIIIAQKKV